MNSKRYRILYIEKPPFIGGSVTGLYELVRNLDTNCYEPVVLFYGPNPYRRHFQALDLQVVTLSERAPVVSDTLTRRDIAASLSRYSNRLATGYRLSKRLYLLARRDRPLIQRVVHLIKDLAIDLVHHNNDLPSNLETILAARLAGVPQICHIRMLHEFSFIERYLARSVSAFLYMSSAIEQLYQNLGIPADKGQVVYDTFDANAYEHLNHPGELRAEFGLTDQDYIITNVGRLDWWKGYEYFVQAMAEVIQTQPRAKALIVGSPDATAQCQAYYYELQQLVTNLHLSDHVIFTGFRADVPRIMAASDVLVHSSSEPEPFGRVVVEAMLAGRPVIATAAGGVLDIVEDQVTGLLVPIKDADSMAKAILHLLQDPEQAKIMGQRAQQHAKERFSVTRHLTAVQGIYQKILSP